MAAPYLRPMLEPPTFERKCRRVIRNIKKMREAIPFNAIAFCGLSGSLIAPVVARSLKASMLPVRKRGENCHSGNYLEAVNKDECRVVILDDFVECGTTIKHIYTTLSKWHPNAKVVGIALHRKMDTERLFLLDNKKAPAPSEYMIDDCDDTTIVPKWYV